MYGYSMECRREGKQKETGSLLRYNFEVKVGSEITEFLHPRWQLRTIVAGANARLMIL